MNQPMISWSQNQLIEQIQKLKAQLASAREVIEFYGDHRDSWLMKKAARHEYTVIDELDVERVPTPLDDGCGVYLILPC